MSETQSSRRPLAVPPAPTITTTSRDDEGGAHVDAVVVDASKDLPFEPTRSRKDTRSGVCFTIVVIVVLSV